MKKSYTIMPPADQPGDDQADMPPITTNRPDLLIASSDDADLTRKMNRCEVSEIAGNFQTTLIQATYCGHHGKAFLSPSETKTAATARAKLAAIAAYESTLG